jgi:periplasmic protein CpxP/Spy
MHRPGGGMMGGLPLLRSFHALNLTDAQKHQVHDLLSKAHEQFATKRPPGPPADMLALVNPGDPGYAKAVQAAKARAADRIQHRSDLNQQLYGVLTADQKTQLTKMLATWKARMAQRGAGPTGPLDSVNR